MQYTLEIVNHYTMIVWQNVYTKWFIFFLIYLVLLYLILIPLSKKFLIPLINKTRTNLDDKIYEKNKWYLRFFGILIWIIIVYDLYFINLWNHLIDIFYNFILSITYIVAYIIIHKTLKIVFKFIVRKYRELITENIANLLKLTIDVLVIVIVWLLVLNAWHINIWPLLAWAGIFGLAVAMASKNIIENFLSWLIIFTDKSLNIGDVIQLSDGTYCLIQEINIRTTILKTFDGNAIILPNSDFLNQKIVNKSLSEVSDKKRVEVNVWISYGDDTEKAKELIASYLTELDGADKTSVVVYVSSLSNWSVDIVWRIMIEDKKWSYLMAPNVTEKVYKEFSKHWLSFPFPTYTIDGKEIKVNTDKSL